MEKSVDIRKATNGYVVEVHPEHSTTVFTSLDEALAFIRAALGS